MLYAGTIEGGTVTPSGLVLSSSGTLSGVIYDGTLDLSGEETSVHFASGTVVNNAAGTGAGTINDTGEYSNLYFDNMQTFNNATINLGSTSGYSVLEEDDLTGAGTVLTLGSGVTIDESGYAYIETGDHAGDGIVNQGNISQTASGGTLVIAGNSFTNNGTITAASSGGILTIDTTTFTNNGAIDISNGETVTINSPASTTMIATNGTTTLAQVGNLFELNPAGGGTGPLLELNGSVVTAGQFPAGWTPVGAETDGERVRGRLERARQERICGLEHRRQRRLHERRDGISGVSAAGDRLPALCDDRTPTVRPTASLVQVGNLLRAEPRRRRDGAVA